MGYFEIIADWQICDKCEKPKATHEGAYETHEGMKILWMCRDCK